jgi:hypothetical protein
LEASSVAIGLKCAWNGISKEDTNKSPYNQLILEEQSILLSGSYGDDVAFVKQSNDHILIGKRKLCLIEKKNYFLFKKRLIRWCKWKLSTWSRSIFVCSYINKFMCVRN